jgi:hypothetical protein
MSLSGFGDLDRKLDITPLPLDSTVLGIKRRDSLAKIASKLKDSDNKTDLFGAIQEVLVEVSKMDPSLRHSAPPVLVLLSDFRPDPAPSPTAQNALCEELQKDNVDLVEVGFGNLDRSTANYLAQCAGTTLWGVVSDPAALPEVFWKLQNRFSKSLKVFERNVAGTQDVSIPIPKWADELLILGLNERAGETTSDWTWSGDRLMQLQPGERYRLARVPLANRNGEKAQTSIHIAQSGNVKLIAVARGPLVLHVKTEPPSPWFRSENVRLTASLVAQATGEAVTDWEAAAGAQYSGDLRLEGGGNASLGYDPETKIFKGTMAVPPAPRITADASVSIDGAIWTARVEGASVAVPVDPGLDDQGRLVIRTWTLGKFAKQRLRSTIPNREIDVTVDSTGPIEVVPNTFALNASKTDISVGFRGKEAPASWYGLSSWFAEPSPRVGSIKFDTRLPSGQIITSDPPIAVVLEVRPLWSRVLIALVIGGGLIWVIISLALGRRLPPWFLVSIDAAGRPIGGADPIRLRSYRRSIDLTQFGMPGAVIYRTLSGKVGVRLHGQVRMQVSGSSALSELSQDGSKSAIGIGDSLRLSRSDGAQLIFKIDVF